jgi:hypothetical protein
MKIKQVVSQLLTNKWVLNVVALISVFNVIGYIMMGYHQMALLYIIIGCLVSYFSKNMTIVLGVPLIVVNLLSLGKSKREGLENNQPSKEVAPKEEEKKPVKKPSSKQDKKTSQGLSMKKINEDDVEEEDQQDGFEPGRAKNKGKDIDYASTIEDAYDELNNILGSDGIQRLTTDSQKLMKQQMQLAEAMKNMTPLFKSIEPMVQNLQGMMGNMDDKGGMGGIMALAQKLVPPQK